MLTVLKDITGIHASKKDHDFASIAAQGKVFVVTGGHAGIGYETTKKLAVAGARVILASRTKSKVRDAIQKLVAEDAALSDRLAFVQLDLADLAQVKQAADHILETEERLDGIVCNAGIMAVPYELTKDGIEQQFQVNHLSHWLFTRQLMPLLERTAKTTGHPSRVVNLSSFAHNFITFYPAASPRFKTLKDVNRSFEPLGWIRYSQAKLSAILFSRELNNRSSDLVRSIAVHPGFVKSDLYASTSARLLLSTFISVDDGALTSYYAAASDEVEEKKLWGSYLVPFAKVKPTTKAGSDPQLAKDLWDLCERIIQDKLGI